jgi:hypothetical protein
MEISESASVRGPSSCPAPGCIGSLRVCTAQDPSDQMDIEDCSDTLTPAASAAMVTAAASGRARTTRRTSNLNRDSDSDSTSLSLTPGDLKVGSLQIDDDMETLSEFESFPQYYDVLPYSAVVLDRPGGLEQLELRPH